MATDDTLMNQHNLASPLVPLSPTLKNQWLASLELTFCHSAQGTQLHRTTRKGPLSVQKAFYPEGRDCAHVYLLHPPAGIVSGDELHLALNIEQSAHTLLTTPGANRFYRARDDFSIGDPQQLQVGHYYLKENAILENLPLETLIYEGAHAINQVDIHMTRSSVYLGWDISCLGSPLTNKPFELGRFTQLNRLYVDDKLVFHDRIAITPENQLLHKAAGLANHSVFATFIVAAPQALAEASQRKLLVTELREKIIDLEAQRKVSVTDIGGVLVIRYLGHHSEECKQYFNALWQTARPACINKPALKPRIWYT